LRLNDILDAIARTLDWPGIAQQPYLEKRESVRKLLQTKRYLLIVDNFETITDDAVRDFLLKIPEPSKVLITSREQKLPQAWAVSIKGLEQDEALALIRNEGQRLGLKSVEKADDQVLLRLYKATGGAPLAIKWSVGQIKQKGQSLDTVLTALHEAKGDIFEQVFARSWSLLTEDAQKVLMVMPIFASSASRDAIEAASDVHHFALDEALGQLVQMWLVEVTDELEAAKRRYSVHPLTRAFAAYSLKSDEKFDNQARNRISNYYVDFVKQYGGKNLEHFEFLDIEKENIFEIIEWCFNMASLQNALLQNALNLTRELVLFLGVRGLWEERIKYSKLALKAAYQIGDSDIAGIILINDLGFIYLFRGDYSKAKSYIEQGIIEANKTKNHKALVLGKRHLAWIAREESKISEAKLLIQEALEQAELIQYEPTKNALYSDLGELELQCKNYKEAEFLFRKALKGFENLGLIHRVAKRLVLIGEVLLLQNRLDESLQTYRDSLKLSQKYKTQDLIVFSKLGLAKLYEKKGYVIDALNMVKEAYSIFEILGIKKYINESQEMIVRLEKEV